MTKRHEVIIDLEEWFPGEKPDVLEAMAMTLSRNSRVARHFLNLLRKETEDWMKFKTKNAIRQRWKDKNEPTKP